MITISDLPHPATKGDLSNDLKKIYVDEQAKFSKKYLTCGSTLGLILNNKNISVCPAKDEECGVLDSGWANTNLISGMQYAAITISQAQKAQVRDKKCLSKKQYDSLFKPKDAHWMEFFMSLIFLYNRSEVENLVTKGLANYFEKAKDSISYAHKFSDPEEFLGEYQIISSYHTPQPAIILVGKPVVMFENNYIKSRSSLLLEKLQKKFENSNIIFYSNLVLVSKNKKNNETGTLRRSFEGLKVLQDINRFI